MTYGKIHSFESMGLVDGPGIRSVVFLQGCHLRCRYCHNPDTWSETSANMQLWSPEQLVQRLTRFKPYYGATGGVTFSGGEPLLQKEFLKEALPLCKQAGIPTCIDTAGVGLGDYDQILQHTDLVILDIKHYTAEGYKKITGQSIDAYLEFERALMRSDCRIWIRHVVVPGLTDAPDHLNGLADYLKAFRPIERIELLPYHVLGVSKYHEMQLPYPLEGVPPLQDDRLSEWQHLLNMQLSTTIV